MEVIKSNVLISLHDNLMSRVSRSCLGCKWSDFLYSLILLWQVFVAKYILVTSWIFVISLCFPGHRKHLNKSFITWSRVDTLPLPVSCFITHLLSTYVPLTLLCLHIQLEGAFPLADCQQGIPLCCVWHKNLFEIACLLSKTRLDS